jgi:hypothetical protein
MFEPAKTAVAVIGIDIGKNSFHVVGLDQRGAIALRQRWSRGQVEARLAKLPPCLIGMEGFDTLTQVGCSPLADCCDQAAAVAPFQA